MSDATIPKDLPEDEVAELQAMAELSDEDLRDQIYASPLYLKHKLDGKDIRVCPGDGDVYFGEAVGPEGGVRMSDGGLMCIHPLRAGVGCLDQDAEAHDIEADEVKNNREVLIRVLQTLTWCEKHPEDQVTKENGREALLRWEARFKKD